MISNATVSSKVDDKLARLNQQLGLSRKVEMAK